MNQDPPDTDEPIKGPLQGLLSRKGMTAIVLGFAGLMLLGIFLSNLGGGEPDPIFTPTTDATAGTSATNDGEDEPGHQIPPLDGCTLLSTDEVTAALGLPEETGMFQFSGGEGCVWRPSEEDASVAGRSVELMPGNAADFEAGALLNDVAGTSLNGVGDTALWFGAEGVGTLTAVKQTDTAYLLMRLSVERADIGDEERLRLASDLMRSAIDMVVLGPPEPIEVNLCDLVTDDEAEELLAPHREGRAAARDPLFVTDNFGDTVDLSQPGEFECSKLIFTEIYVKVQTVANSDFGEGAHIEGVAGVPIGDIGDAAMWFEDVPFSSPFASPHEMDVMSVLVGDAGFRIVLALPDLDSETQFETAQLLARKAAGRIPGGPGELITVDPEVPDFSNLGFVDNLLAKQEAGEWTLEEGLIANLRLFAGEVVESQVLRHDELADFSGTGIIEMAQEYLKTADDGPTKDEIGRLLDLLIPTLGPTAPPEVSASLTVSLGSLLLPGPVAQEEEEEPGTSRGYAPPSDDVPFDYPSFPPGPGECAAVEPTLEGWDISGYEVPDHGPWTGAVLFPSVGLEDGWKRETHLSWALEALTDSIAEYGTPPVCLRLLLSHHGGSHTFVEQRINPSICLVFVNKPMQNRDPDQFRQQLAADIAHCYIPWVFPDQFDVTYLTRRWWNHALAEYSSNVVYPNTNLEWRLAPAMATQEITRPLVERGSGNWMFFQEVANATGGEGVAAIVEALPGGDNLFFDQLALADVQEMGQFYHTFSQHMTDSVVKDTGNGFIPYQPPKVAKSLSGPATHEQELIPFQTTRWEVRVPSGKYACLTGQMSNGAMVSYQKGRVGAPTGSWAELPDTETAFEGDFVVVGTAIEEEETFSLMVRDVHDEPDCEDEEEVEQAPPPPAEACECDPSDYFLVWQDIPGILQELLNPPAG